MKQALETSTDNGKPQVEQIQATALGTEGAQAPSAEVKQPFVAEKKKTTRPDNWKAIFAGVAIAAVIVVAALTPKVGTKLPRPSTTRPSAGTDTQPSPSQYGNVIPINEIGNSPERPADGTKVGPGAIANTAKPRPNATAATNLNEVPPFGSAGDWHPPDFHGNAQPTASDQQEEKVDHDVLDKPSLVFVHGAARTTTPERGQAAANDVELGLGLAPGTRLRAHLESAVSTAVKTPVVAVIEYNYERDGENSFQRERRRLDTWNLPTAPAMWVCASILC